LIFAYLQVCLSEIHKQKIAPQSYRMDHYRRTRNVLNNIATAYFRMIPIHLFILLSSTEKTILLRDLKFCWIQIC